MPREASDSGTAVHVVDMDVPTDTGGNEGVPGSSTVVPIRAGSCEINAATESGIQGLVAHYRMSGNAADTSGHGLHGVLHGATPAPDAVGNAGGALQFDGSDDYVMIPQNPAFELESFTLSVILKAPRTPTRNWVLGRGKMFGNFSVYIAGRDEPWPSMAYYAHVIPDVGNFSSQLSRGFLDPERFVALAVEVETTDEGTAVVTTYANGELVYGPTLNPSPDTTPAPLYLGAGGYYDAPTDFFTGTLDDVRIYDRALSAEEVRAIQCVTREERQAPE